MGLKRFLEENYPTLRGRISGGEHPISAKAKVGLALAQSAIRSFHTHFFLFFSVFEKRKCNLRELTRFSLFLATVGQLVGSALALVGDQIFNAMGLGAHPLAMQILGNRMGLLGMGFVLSSVAQNAAATGAFEIYLNGEAIFSKLQTHRMVGFFLRGSSIKL